MAEVWSLMILMCAFLTASGAPVGSERQSVPQTGSDCHKKICEAQTETTLPVVKLIQLIDFMSFGEE